MKPDHYDREGKPISFECWIELRHQPGYIRVAEDTVGDFWISTVWLGIDHGSPLEGTAPIIFETMVFGANRESEEMRRYSTEEQALAGHREMVEEVRLIESLA